MSSALLESIPTHQMETFSDALDLCYTTSGDENAESAEKQEGAAHTDATPVFFFFSIAHLACTGCDSSIQQFSINLLLLLHSGSQGGWGSIPAVFGWRRGFTLDKPPVHYTDKWPFALALIPTTILQFPICLTDTSLDCGREAREPKENPHRYSECIRTTRLLQLSCSEATVVTAEPPCRLQLWWQGKMTKPWVVPYSELLWKHGDKNKAKPPLQSTISSYSLPVKSLDTRSHAIFFF